MIASALLCRFADHWAAHTLRLQGSEGKELQRRWINNQTELVRLQNDNQALSESLQRLRAENTILMQKRRRLEGQFEHTQEDIKKLNIGMTSMHRDIQRINNLISQNSDLRTILQVGWRRAPPPPAGGGPFRWAAHTRLGLAGGSGSACNV